MTNTDDRSHRSDDSNQLCINIANTDNTRSLRMQYTPQTSASFSTYKPTQYTQTAISHRNGAMSRDPLNTFDVSQLISFINCRKMAVNTPEILQCFIENHIDSAYFANHERKDFVMLLKSKCNVKISAAIKLWKHFTANSYISGEDIAISTKVCTQNDSGDGNYATVGIKGDIYDLQAEIACNDRVIKSLETICNEIIFEQAPYADGYDYDSDEMEFGEALSTPWDDDSDHDEFTYDSGWIST